MEIRVENIFEPVITIEEYYDGPRCGVAAYRGQPHHFACIFNEDTDEYSDVFSLVPLTEKSSAAALEIWQMFLRWRTAYELGTTDISTHPALEPDRIDYSLAKHILKDGLNASARESFRSKGQFRSDDSAASVTGHWSVRWSAP